LGRLIKTGSASKDRILLEKGIILAIRELAVQTGMDSNTRDLLAYIALSLKAMSETIDESVAAWEKRGYWIKADHYRMEWNWTTSWGEEMKQAILKEDWGIVAKITAQVTQKLSTVKIAQKNRLGTPWTGSYKRLINPNQSH
jgi:hypothetical protein